MLVLRKQRGITMTKEQMLAIKRAAEVIANSLETMTDEVIECFLGVLITEDEAVKIKSA